MSYEEYKNMNVRIELLEILAEAGDDVVMSYEEYKNMNVRIELLEILAEAEDDVRNVRVAPASETFGDLRKMLQEG